MFKEVSSDLIVEDQVGRKSCQLKLLKNAFLVGLIFLALLAIKLTQQHVQANLQLMPVISVCECE